MTTRINILILFVLTFSFAYGQKPKIRKEIKITTVFDYNYIKDGKHYISKKGKVKHDTLTTELNQDGTLTNPNHYPNITFDKPFYRYRYRDSLVLISNDHNIKHQRAYWSDSTYFDFYTQIFMDSTIQTQLSEGDTIQILKCYFRNGKLIKSHNRDLQPIYGDMHEIIIYEIKTDNREVAIVKKFSSFGLYDSDSFRIDNNIKTKIYKKLMYNKYNKEWYEKEVTQLKTGRKQIKWETFYNHNCKMYFITRTTINYNKYGLPISEELYDVNLKQIITLITYKYEYY